MHEFYISDGFYSALCETCSSFEPVDDTICVELNWYSETDTSMTISLSDIWDCIWNSIASVEAKDIAFTKVSPDPTDVIFIKMEEERKK